MRQPSTHLLALGVLLLTLLTPPTSTSTLRQDDDDVLTFNQEPPAGQPVKRFLLDDDPPLPTMVQKMILVIDVSKSLNILSPTYVSLNIDSNQFRKNLGGFDFSSRKLINMAAALSPANIRFGGTMADFLHFDEDGADTPYYGYPDVDKPDLMGPGLQTRAVDSTKQNFTFPASRWDNLTRFTDEVGWDIMWDFNLFFWTPDGLWDPSQAKRFLAYSAARGVKMPSFQLGNEPNAFQHNFNFSIEPEVLVKDFHILKDVIAVFPQYAASGFYGPEVINLDNHGSSRQYLRKFLESGGCDVVTEVGLHHYYLNGKTATAKDFMDPDVMDTLNLQLDYAFNITWESCKTRKPVRLTETSTAFGGGATGLSDAYIAGFLWLDKLGLCAKRGITHVFRQTFWGGRYSLVGYDLNVNPDFWLTLLYKRLVEGPVFHVESQTASRNLRLYANCVRKSEHYNYPDGALVVYYLNMERESLLSFGEYQNSEMHLFRFSSGDGHGLHSQRMKLNGQVLYMNGSFVPALQPEVHTGDIPVTPESFGFIVIPGAEVPLCKIYHRSRDL